jgi:L-lactate dehydrogenase complex protein LldF
MLSSFAAKFNTRATRLTADLEHRAKIRSALRSYEKARDEKKALFQDWEAARDGAATIKWEAVNHLDAYLVRFVEKLEARGTKVFWASNAQEARDYIVALAKEKGARSIIKSKTMTSEEIHLNDSLRQAGYEVVESDLGEFIVQLREEAPYHLVFPAMHLTRTEISDLFHEKLHSAPTDNPEQLTMIARRELRLKYLRADIGISGANFGIAETGMISITENEGNARLTTALPRVHVALMGIEKVIPKLSDLALFLPMLATAGTGQHLLQLAHRRASTARRTGRPSRISSGSPG